MVKKARKKVRTKPYTTVEFMDEVFGRVTHQGKSGWYAYKGFEVNWRCRLRIDGYVRLLPKSWTIEEGSWLIDVVDLDRRLWEGCGKGIHCATKEWIQDTVWHGDSGNMYFKVFLPFTNSTNIIIPDDVFIDRQDRKHVEKRKEIKIRTDKLLLVRREGKYNYGLPKL